MDRINGWIEGFQMDEDGGVAGLTRAIAVIISSEIGDKTFLIAAILSMRHSRLRIFCAAILALAVMSLLSALMGHMLPFLLPRKYTTAAAALLFLVFGVKMVKEGWEMKEEDGKEKMQEEIAEVQREVEDIPEEKRGRGSNGEAYPMRDLESGPSPPHSPRGPPGGGHTRKSSSSTTAAQNTFREGASNLLQLFFSPVFVQGFVLTFLAEWGDRSQITTIAMAAAHNVWIVTIGTTLGHSFCTALAVIAGRYIASKISVKQVTLGGAFLFLIFGVVYGYEAWTWDESSHQKTVREILRPAALPGESPPDANSAVGGLGR